MYVDLRFNVKVVGDGPQRRLQVDLGQLVLRGHNDSLPVLYAKSLPQPDVPKVLKNPWEKLASEVLALPEFKDKVFGKLSEMLNSEAIKRGINDMLEQQLNWYIDAFLGDLPTVGLPVEDPQGQCNSVDQYLICRAVASLRNAASKYFMPVILGGGAGARLEPLIVDKIDIGDQKIAGMPWGPNIFSEVMVCGLANNMPNPAWVVLGQQTLKISTKQGQLLQPPIGIPSPPLTISGNFLFTPTGLGAIVGTFHTYIGHSSLCISCKTEGETLDTWALTIEHIDFTVNPSDLHLKLNIRGCHGLAPFANNLVASPVVKKKMMAEINAAISSKEVLDNINVEINKIARGEIFARLGRSIAQSFQQKIALT